MQGIFYGVGVGPGEPELMTVKAVRTIQQCEVIAIAVSSPELQAPEYEEAGSRCSYPQYLEKCVAYQIALPMVPEMTAKAKLYLPMPMRKEKELLKQVHDNCAKKTAEILEQGKDVAFITLGDPSVYSTCLYVHRRLKHMQYQTRLIAGIPSFCAAAARLNDGLVENQEELHVIPASYEVESGLELSGTRVLMKAGKKMPYVKRKVKERHLQIQMVENCGMESEQIYHSVDEIPDAASYYSLLIVKEGQE